MKSIYIRFAAVVIATMIDMPLSAAYYSSSLYQGVANTPLPTMPDFQDLLGILLTAVLLIGLKYLIYDAIATRMIRNHPHLAAKIIFYIGYAIALFIDLACVFVSMTPISDAGLAILGAILYSPVVMIVALIVIALINFITKRKSASTIR